MKKNDVIIGSGSIAFGSLFFAMAFTIKETKASSASAALFPKIISAALILMGILLLVREYVRSRSGKGTTGPTRFENPKLLIASMSGMIIYAALLRILGFSVCTFLYLLFMMHILDENKKKYWSKILYSGALTAAILVMFGSFFNATLPVGILWGG